MTSKCTITFPLQAVLTRRHFGNSLSLASEAQACMGEAVCSAAKATGRNIIRRQHPVRGWEHNARYFPLNATEISAWLLLNSKGSHILLHKTNLL